MENPFSALIAGGFDIRLEPAALLYAKMRLDPDFEYVTLWWPGKRARQLRACFSAGELIVFYAGLFDGGAKFVYAIAVSSWSKTLFAADVPINSRHINAAGTGTAPVSGSWGMGVPNSGAMLRAPMDTKQIQAVAAEI